MSSQIQFSSFQVVLWVYIVLLLVGGLMGLIKGKSKVSLIMSAVFAAALALCALGFVSNPLVPEVLLGLLLVVFLVRLAKTRKFMPAGMMALLTVVVLGLGYALQK